jgi:hypothetical protein
LLRELVWKLQVRQCCPLLFGENGRRRRKKKKNKNKAENRTELDTNFFKSSNS